jgi:hypothetical protein
MRDGKRGEIVDFVEIFVGLFNAGGPGLCLVATSSGTGCQLSTGTSVVGFDFGATRPYSADVGRTINMLLLAIYLSFLLSLARKPDIIRFWPDGSLTVAG